MSLTPPKRLFHIPTMSTVMYVDVVDDVKEKGYVAISHVWGDQKLYSADELGILSGVDWKIPLSNSNKIARILDAMARFKKEYCWLDVLCMPQGEENQKHVNEEIPFMGNYYAGANVVLVLSTVDPIVTDEFTKWYDIMVDVIEKNRNFTKEEEDWMRSYERSDAFDISGEKWFTRLWTFQEAVMADKLFLICSSGHYNLVDIAKKMEKMNILNVTSDYMFRKSARSLIETLTVMENRSNGYLDLAQVMSECSNRDCFKPQDKFYGVLGILGYKDFSVDYNISMEDLNKNIVKYAYSKGDLSWLSVGGNTNEGFIQPMDKLFSYVGWGWSEDIPGICGVRLEEKIMYINAWCFATVVCHEKLAYDGNIENHPKFRANMHDIFKSWGLDKKDIIRNMSRYVTMSDDETDIANLHLEYSHTGNAEVFRDIYSRLDSDTCQKYTNSSTVKMDVLSGVTELTIVKATTWKGKDIPLTIHGNTKTGDQIMLIKMTDAHETCLGIAVDEHFRRKGVCYYEKIEMTDEAISRYIPHKFTL